METHSIKCSECNHSIDFYIPEIYTAAHPPLQPSKPVMWLKKVGSLYYRCDQFGAIMHSDVVGVDGMKLWWSLEFWRVIYEDFADIRIWEPPVDCTTLADIRISADFVVDEAKKSDPLDVGKLNDELHQLRTDVIDGELDAGEASLEKWRLLIAFASNCETWGQFGDADWNEACGLCEEHQNAGYCGSCPIKAAEGSSCVNLASWKGMLRAERDCCLRAWIGHAQGFHYIIERSLKAEKKEEPQLEWIYGVWKTATFPAYAATAKDGWYVCYTDHATPEESLDSLVRQMKKSAGRRLRDHWQNDGCHINTEGIPLFGVRELTEKEWRKQLGYVGENAHYTAAFRDGQMIENSWRCGASLDETAKKTINRVLDMLHPTITLDDLAVAVTKHV